jgi:hypothetical protein
MSSFEMMSCKYEEEQNTKRAYEKERSIAKRETMTKPPRNMNN